MRNGRVLITGGASGIGAATAARCREEGYEPIVVDLRGGDIRADLMDPKDTARALESALVDGPITRLVNNVGVVIAKSVEQQTQEDVERAVRLNVSCALQCLQALVPGMKAAGFGRIVNMSSRAALGKEHRTAYAMTKAGLIGMTRVWRWSSGPMESLATPSGPARSRPSFSTSTTLTTRLEPGESSMPCLCVASERPRTWRTPWRTSWMSAAASSLARSCTSAVA